MVLKEIFRKYFAKIIYPTYSGDWYKRKGYQGSSHQERFNDFLLKQKKPGSLYYKEFKSLNLTREFVNSGQALIDSVKITPSKALSKDMPGNGLYIICFQGKNEYYESRFRDMAIMARQTGAVVIGFNPKGFHASTGKTKVLGDIVDDGIALVEYLLTKYITPKQIVCYGNSLGAGVQSIVCEYFKKLKSINFRQINSNSYRSIAAVIASNYQVPFLEKKLYWLMKYVGWEATYNKDYYQIGIYKSYLTRKNDRTIKPSAAFSANVNLTNDFKVTPKEYRATMKWLDQNSELIWLTPTKADPHNISLHHFHLKALDKNGKHLTPWDFINRYLEVSNKFVI